MEPRPLDTDAPDQLERQGSPSPSPRKPYTTPRLTKHGAIVVQTAEDFSGLTDQRCDRALKEGLAPVDPRQVLAGVLALPITTWSYKGETVRHLGPMAQDFVAAFGLGADDRHIHPIDASGVALAALQGLHAVVQAQAARLASLERELDALRAELRGRAEARDGVGVGA